MGNGNGEIWKPFVASIPNISVPAEARFGRHKWKLGKTNRKYESGDDLCIDSQHLGGICVGHRSINSRKAGENWVSWLGIWSHLWEVEVATCQ